MRIIFANKFHFRQGGADGYALDAAELLRERRGFAVAPFAMRHERNLQSEWSRYFVSEVETGRASSAWSALRTAARFLWSSEAARKFTRLAKAFKPDLVHAHNLYHQLSPSPLAAARRLGLPVVLTAHDYALLSPNYALFHDGAICERGLESPWRAVGHRCVRGSRAASALCAAEVALHRALGAYRRNVDYVIAPSRFVQAKFLEAGWPEDRVVHLPHYVDSARWQPVYGGEYALYLGRLSEEKGVATLIEAAGRRPDIPLLIVGDGPERARLEARAHELGAYVSFLGRLEGERLKRAVSGSKFVVVPSVWFEPFGLVALEAFAAGKPVIASQIGGLGELIDDGRTGLFVSAGKAQELARAMGELWDTPGVAESMGMNARREATLRYSVDGHLKGLTEVYWRARSRRR
jgi:glycosyltransferase involved in cell wall biosynthesis